MWPVVVVSGAVWRAARASGGAPAQADRWRRISEGTDVNQPEQSHTWYGAGEHASARLIVAPAPMKFDKPDIRASSCASAAREARAKRVGCMRVLARAFSLHLASTY